VPASGCESRPESTPVSATIKLHRNDLPAGLGFTGSVAIDTETLGLKPVRDRLCLVQLSAGDDTAHLVQLDGKDWSAPRLKTMLADPAILKIFHFGRFDMAMLSRYLGVMPEPVYCTKIASKLARTYTDRHGLKDLCSELLGIDLSKQQQSSDWAAEKLSDQQKHYAASDVLYLHALKAKLDMMLEREGRTAVAEACFRFLPTRARLDLAGFDDDDIFAH
jgi:ribonuclease D